MGLIGRITFLKHQIFKGYRGRTNRTKRIKKQVLFECKLIISSDLFVLLAFDAKFRQRKKTPNNMFQ